MSCTETNTSFADEPLKVASPDKIDFAWQDTAPITESPADKFSIRWQGNFDFNADKYRFIAQVDDGVRVWVDNQLVIDQWAGKANQEYTADIVLTAGKHLVKVEYKEEYGWASARVNWEQMRECSGIPDNSFCG